MKTAMFKISELKNKLESAVFIEEGAAKEAHTELIQSLIIVSELESIYCSPWQLSHEMQVNHACLTISASEN